jgi:hypothetical protein
LPVTIISRTTTTAAAKATTTTTTTTTTTVVEQGKLLSESLETVNIQVGQMNHHLVRLTACSAAARCTEFAL